MKSVHMEEYKLLTNWLIDQRTRSNLTQTEIAKRLGKPQSYVSKYEKGERRLDVIEFIAATKAIGASPDEVIKKLLANCD